MSRIKIEIHVPETDRGTVAQLLAEGAIDAVVACKTHGDMIVIAYVDALVSLAPVLKGLFQSGACKALAYHLTS